MITRKLPSSLQLLLTQNEFLHYMLSCPQRVTHYSKNHSNYALQEFVCVESEICKLHFNGQKTDRQTNRHNGIALPPDGYAHALQ